MLDDAGAVTIRERLVFLKAAWHYLETCSLDQFRAELVVHALDGASPDERRRAIEAAELELDHGMDNRAPRPRA